MNEIRHHPAQRLSVNGIEIVADAFGAPNDPPLLLVAGLGNQMISWPDPFCRRLAAPGYRVIRFDNRDAGLSTRLSGQEVPGLAASVWAYMRNAPIALPYTLADMADDAVGLLDALGIPDAHIIGGSLGGMIAQMIALRHPQRVRTLSLLMSTAFDPRTAPPQPRALVLFKSSPRDRAGYIDHAEKVRRGLHGRGIPFDATFVRSQAARRFDRSADTSGSARQMAALLASIRVVRAGLGAITAPTLVVHGRHDPLLPLRHGRRLAAAIPHAALRIIDGMGHGLPPPVWPPVLTALHEHLEGQAG